MTIVDLTKIGFKDEPFILAKNVHQVFYVKDMTSKPKNKNLEGPQEPNQMAMINSMACLHSLSKLTQAYRLEVKRHRTYVTTMTKELSSRKETSILYYND
jgi:hypothetical protein